MPRKALNWAFLPFSRACGYYPSHRVNKSFLGASMLYPMRDGLLQFINNLDKTAFVPKRYFHMPSAIPFLRGIKQYPHGLRYQTPMPYIACDELKEDFYFMEYVH